MDYAQLGDIIIKTLLAIVLGGAIGVERQLKHRPAGFRTHILVCIGSMTIMLLSELMFVKYHTIYGAIPDPARLGAQVISGIGFLGAGTIIHYGANVRGLTTAASIWAVAGIGLTIGAGFYTLAIVSTVAIYASLFVFNIVSRKMNNSGNILDIMITVINKPKAIGEINLLFDKHGVQILDMEFINKPDLSIVEEQLKTITIHVITRLSKQLTSERLIGEIEQINGVIRVEKI